MKYILHDSSSMDDEKLTELFIEYGYEGTGLFWAILERLAKQEKPIKTQVLKSQLKIGKKLDKVWNFIETIGLVSSSNGETFNKQLLNYSETYKIKKEKNAKRISQWRDNQNVEENVTCYENVRNTPKVNRSKVNEIEVEEEKINTLTKTFYDTLKCSIERPIENSMKMYFYSTNFESAISILMQNHNCSAKSENDLKFLALEFNEHLTLEGKLKKSLNDWAKHFRFWIIDPNRKLAHEALKESKIEHKTIVHKSGHEILAERKAKYG